MILLRLFELALIVVCLLGLLTQVVIPAFNGTRFFPIFDKRRRAAIEELVRAKDEAELEEVHRAAHNARRPHKENDHV